MSILLILLVLMIIAAIIAIETANLLSSIVCVGAAGFLVSIAFLFLGAPDIAITQLVVEVLCLIVLIRATISRDLTAVSGDREFFGLTVTVAIVLVIAVIGIGALDEFPAFGIPAMSRVRDAQGALDAPSVTYLAEGLSKTGAANAVTGVLLDFRAYDTLGEATVLFCAIMGSLAILRKTARKKREDAETESDAL